MCMQTNSIRSGEEAVPSRGRPLRLMNANFDSNRSLNRLLVQRHGMAYDNTYNRMIFFNVV
ncbi:hypothetical protein PAECIP111802_01850 [Paenibacillus allorhizosphaerae]|uniref:Uncharacterized protein n=1 Tax=Paenibacillus allorhizosphaerae TaxID=2849866 RepID=A0ABN7TII5_9BACL|nr:hypothetical protein PAECIP111802_01850 [Paenibacillus allorhizosphaerae]